MEFEEKTISQKEIYQGPIFKLVQDQVELPEEKSTVVYHSLNFQTHHICFGRYFFLIQSE